MNSHLLTDGSDLVNSFKKLSRSSRAPSGRLCALPHPTRELLRPPAANPIRHRVRGWRNSLLPENVTDAAPDIAKGLMHAFVKGLGMGRGGPAPFAPWKLTTEDKDMAKAVGDEFKRLGVAQALWSIGISSTSTIESAHVEFTRVFSLMTSSMGLPVAATPHSIRFLSTDVPDAYDPEEHSSILAYSMSLRNTKPPSADSIAGKLAPGAEMMRELEIATKLLEAKPAEVIKAEADAGDPIAATDYGIRCALRLFRPAFLTLTAAPGLYHGIQCPLDRRGSRAYLVQAITSPTAEPGTKAMAHAMLVIWHTAHFRGPSKAIVQRYVFAGAYHANESARIIRPVLPAGSAAAPTVLITAPELAFLCKDAFRAADDRSQQMNKERAKASVKRMDHPNRYRCANPGCGIEADSGRVLRQCSGACDRDKKPSYCGAACQKADWKNHKPFCKTGAPCSVIDTGFATVPSARGTANGAIQVQMGGTTFSSSTMTPEFMKEIKEQWDREQGGVFLADQ
ncbi:hypothetical protein FB451DRAFT_1373879 [Mycena latifolia]|nr:hypothetical protein FB451DRAFT_1373879 [Mycena latifolia]